jgi:transglutaminase-like putative cysteine protease
MSDAGALLEVEHQTRYRYESPVDLAHHLAHLRPLGDARQAVHAFALDVVPGTQHQRSDIDGYGNARLCFTVAQPHRELVVRAASRVLLRAPAWPAATATLPWESVRERLRYAAGAAFEPASAFAFPSPFVPRLEALLGLAPDVFVPGRPVAEVAEALMSRIHGSFAYRSESTLVDTPLAEVIARREGVCQDFAHLMIGVLRLHGLAARYVSGYLLTSAPEDQDGAPGAPWQGADASHAWVSVWCPTLEDAGAWIEYDPTNHVRPSLAHVRVAVGRDYGDVAPLRGVIRGGGKHRLDVHVRTARVA